MREERPFQITVESLLGGLVEQKVLTAEQAADLLSQKMFYQGNRAAETYEFEPPWCKGGGVQIASASGREILRKEVDFSKWYLGRFTFCVELKQDEKGEGYLIVDWEATEPNPKGWYMAFYLRDDVDDAVLTLSLGSGTNGREMLFRDRLRFDPLNEVFRVMVFLAD